MEITKRENTQEALDKNVIWKQCLLIYEGYVNLGIKTPEEAKAYLDNEQYMSKEVKDVNYIIYCNVSKYNSEEDPKLKTQYQVEAIKAQSNILKGITKDLELQLEKINISKIKRLKSKKRKNIRKIKKKSKQYNRKH